MTLSQHSPTELADPPTERFEVPVQKGRPAPRPVPHASRPAPHAMVAGPRRHEPAPKLPWFLALGATALLAFMVGVGVGGSGSPSTVSVPVAEPAPLVGGTATPDHVGPYKLEATSKLGRELTVNYANGTGGQDSSPRGTKSSFAITVPDSADPYSTGYMSVSSSPDFDEYASGKDPKSDTITCRITDAKGVVVDEKSATGTSSNVYCSGS